MLILICNIFFVCETWSDFLFSRIIGTDFGSSELTSEISLVDTIFEIIGSISTVDLSFCLAGSHFSWKSDNVDRFSILFEVFRLKFSFYVKKVTIFKINIPIKTKKYKFINHLDNTCETKNISRTH